MIDGGDLWHFKVRTLFPFLVETEAQILYPIHFSCSRR